MQTSACSVKEYALSFILPPVLNITSVSIIKKATHTMLFEKKEYALYAIVEFKYLHNNDKQLSNCCNIKSCVQKQLYH